MPLSRNQSSTSCGRGGRDRAPRRRCPCSTRTTLGLPQSVTGSAATTAATPAASAVRSTAPRLPGLLDALADEDERVGREGEVVERAPRRPARPRGTRRGPRGRRPSRRPLRLQPDRARARGLGPARRGPTARSASSISSGQCSTVSGTTPASRASASSSNPSTTVRPSSSRTRRRRSASTALRRGFDADVTCSSAMAAPASHAVTRARPSHRPRCGRNARDQHDDRTPTRHRAVRRLGRAAGLRARRRGRALRRRVPRAQQVGPAACHLDDAIIERDHVVHPRARRGSGTLLIAWQWITQPIRLYAVGTAALPVGVARQGPAHPGLVGVRHDDGRLDDRARREVRLPAGAARSSRTPCRRRPGYSFPSGHALNSAAWATIVVILLWPLLKPLWARSPPSCSPCSWSLMTALDRVLLGVHYPSDVTVGVLTGVGLALASYAGYVGWNPPRPDRGRRPRRRTPTTHPRRPDAVPHPLGRRPQPSHVHLGPARRRSCAPCCPPSRSSLVIVGFGFLLKGPLRRRTPSGRTASTAGSRTGAPRPARPSRSSCR